MCVQRSGTSPGNSRILRILRVKKHFSRRNGEESLFPTLAPFHGLRVVRIVRIVRIVRKVRVFPVGSRSFVARPWADGTAAGKEHGAARPKPRAGENPLHRVKMLPHFFVCCGTTNVPVERWSFFPVGSRTVTCSARCPNRPNCRNCPKSSREMLWDHLCHYALTSNPFPPSMNHSSFRKINQ